jgi:hypothetical protein
LNRRIAGWLGSSTLVKERIYLFLSHPGKTKFELTFGKGVTELKGVYAASNTENCCEVGLVGGWSGAVLVKQTDFSPLAGKIDSCRHHMGFDSRM